MESYLHAKKSNISAKFERNRFVKSTDKGVLSLGIWVYLLIFMFFSCEPSNTSKFEVWTLVLYKFQLIFSIRILLNFHHRNVNFILRKTFKSSLLLQNVNLVAEDVQKGTRGVTGRVFRGFRAFEGCFAFTSARIIIWTHNWLRAHSNAQKPNFWTFQEPQYKNTSILKDYWPTNPLRLHVKNFPRM